VPSQGQGERPLGDRLASSQAGLQISARPTPGASRQETLLPKVKTQDQLHEAVGRALAGLAEHTRRAYVWDP